MISLFLKCLANINFNDPVLQEAAAVKENVILKATRNYTRTAGALQNIKPPSSIDPLCKIAMSTGGK